MRVFAITAPDGYDWVLPKKSAEIETLRFDGHSLAPTWQPVSMRRLAIDDDGRALVRSDFPSCSGGEMLMLRQNAVSALGDVLRSCGELLPLDCPDEPLWALNVTNVVDALDETKSQLLRVPDSGKILRVKRAVFRPESLRDQWLFKLASMPRGLIYVTDSFVEKVRSQGLTGIDFKLVWAPS